MNFFTRLFEDILKLANQLDTAVVIVIIINMVLIVFARRLFMIIGHSETKDSQLKIRVIIFRALNLAIIVAFTYYHIYTPEDEASLGFKFLAIFVLVYLSYLTSHVINYIILRRYGRYRDINGTKEYISTYNSRLIAIIVTVMIAIIVLISSVQILGYTSLLEAGGVIGFIGVLLALTQGAWAPDIFSGLIILNSRMAEVGDVIEFNDGHTSLGVIYKTKVFHTEILNLVNNHRIMIKNSRLRDHTIHNLSKFASAKGLREKLSFKIGYDTPIQKVKNMFNAAFAKAKLDADICIEHQYPLEIGTDNAGDFAVEWVIYYYTKEVRQLLRTRQSFIKLILKTAQEYNISLATPQLLIIETNAAVNVAENKIND